MYLDFTFKKSLVMILLFGIITGAIYLTFTTKDVYYGDVRLPTAFKRLWQKESGLVWYTWQNWSNNGGALAALGNLTFNREEPIAEGAQGVPILLYHSVVKNPDGHNVTEAEFSDQMFTLHEAGWHTITLPELKNFLERDMPVPEKSFMITFDDGARDSYYPTDPIFQVLDYSAVSFVLPKHSSAGGTHYYLSAGEINTMLKSGRWEIGSHGQEAHDELWPINARGSTGVYLGNRLWLPVENRAETLAEYRARVGQDLALSKKNVEKIIGRPVNVFAFPFGEFGQLASDQEPSVALRDIAEQLYDFVFYQTYRGEGFSYNYFDADRPQFMIKRIGVLPETSGKELLAILERGEPKDLPYQDTFTNDKGWFPIWGDYRLESDNLVMQTAARQTGTAVVLDGTGHWRDYRFSVTGESPAQTGVLLWVRMEDNKNNAACNFGNGFVHVEEIIQSERKVIKGTRSPEISIPKGDFTVEAEVKGRTLACYLNGEKIVESTFLPQTLERGGIGIKTWDVEEGKSSFIAKEVEVMPL